MIDKKSSTTPTTKS